jgi:AcrR family transcriptional regulator
VNARRPNRREVAAAATRREILRAARRLFAEQGFASTSVHQIAEESGVAVQTIYSSVGSKTALVLALNDLIDEEAGLAELSREVFEEASASRVLAKGVHLTRQLNERCGDIVRAVLSAEPVDPDAAAVLAEGMRRHERGAIGLVNRLAALGALRTDVTPERAIAAFSLMTAAASWRQLTQGAGWTFDDAETWLTESLTQLLLRRKQ